MQRKKKPAEDLEPKPEYVAKARILREHALRGAIWIPAGEPELRVGPQGQEEWFQVHILVDPVTAETLAEEPIKIPQPTGHLTLTEALEKGAPLSLDLAAQYLRKNQMSVRRYVERHGLKAHRPPGTRGLMFYKDEIDEWLRGFGPEQKKKD